MQSEIIQSHFDQIRMDTGSTTVNIPDATLFAYYNRARKSVFKRLRLLGDHYFYNEWTDNIVLGQREYSLPKYREYMESGQLIRQPRCKSVLGVSMLQNGKYISLDRLEMNTSRYIERNQQETGYAVLDNSIFLFPTPTEDVANGIKVYGTYEPYDVTETSSDDEIGIPEDLHEILVERTKAYVYENRQIWDKRNAILQEYMNFWKDYMA